MYVYNVVLGPIDLRTISFDIYTEYMFKLDLHDYVIY